MYYLVKTMFNTFEISTSPFVVFDLPDDKIVYVIHPANLETSTTAKDLSPTPLDRNPIIQHAYQQRLRDPDH